MTGQKQKTEIYLLDGTFKEISYDKATTVADVIKVILQDIVEESELLSYSSFGLYSRVLTAKKGIISFFYTFQSLFLSTFFLVYFAILISLTLNFHFVPPDDLFVLKDNKFIQDIVQCLDSKDRKYRLLLKRNFFYETDEAVLEEAFRKLIYIEVCHTVLLDQCYGLQNT